MPRVVKSPLATAAACLRRIAVWLGAVSHDGMARPFTAPGHASAVFPDIHFSRNALPEPPANTRGPGPRLRGMERQIIPLRLTLLRALIRLGDSRRWSLVLLGPIFAGIFWLLHWPGLALACVSGLPLLALMIPSAAERQHLFAATVDCAPNRLFLDRRLEENLALAARGFQTGLLLLQIDRFARLATEQDDASVERMLRLCTERLRAVLRDGDLALRLEGATFAIALSPTRRLDMDAALQLAARLQRALRETATPVAGKLHLSASVGFALAARIAEPAPDTLMQAARIALGEALLAGPASIRSYSPAMAARVAARDNLAASVGDAIARHEIIAFFQPQISTRTGALTGFEALARWHHPERGLIPPIEFLPALQQAGLMPLLGRHILSEACNALRHWEDAGLHVPHVGVNFSTAELADPDLPARVAAELAARDLTPDRLCIEVLETVVAQGDDDIILHNLAALAAMGCRLDLDDFGTGHASITNIRRFAIARIKVDRSFVTRLDHDPEQQNMMAAILTMAERLDLDTLAEGVETPEELAKLTQMGCGHVQGFAIARPMPLLEATVWQKHHAESRKAAPLLRREAV